MSANGSIKPKIVFQVMEFSRTNFKLITSTVVRTDIFEVLALKN